MLFVYNCIPNFENIRKQCTIDLSKENSALLADHADNLLSHQRECSVFLGYLEIGWMLDAKHEVRLRKLFKKFDVHVICMYPESIPFAWKNGTSIIYGTKDLKKHGDPETIDNGSAL
jgi:hypothetical protein